MTMCSTQQFVYHRFVFEYFKETLNRCRIFRGGRVRCKVSIVRVRFDAMFSQLTPRGWDCYYFDPDTFPDGRTCGPARVIPDSSAARVGWSGRVHGRISGTHPTGSAARERTGMQRNGATATVRACCRLRAGLPPPPPTPASGCYTGPGQTPAGVVDPLVSTPQTPKSSVVRAPDPAPM